MYFGYVKKVVKALLSIAASLFLLFRSIELMRQLAGSSPGDLNGWEQTFVGAFMAITVTGVVALPGFALPTSCLLPQRYFHIKKPQKLLYWYKILGVDFFRKLLLLAFWGQQKNRKRYFDGTRSGFDNLIYQSKQSEFGHLLPLIALQIIATFCFVKGFAIVALVITIINIIGNFYPIPLQRMHRYRIARLRELHEKHSRIS